MSQDVPFPEFQHLEMGGSEKQRLQVYELRMNLKRDVRPLSGQIFQGSGAAQGVLANDKSTCSRKTVVRGTII